ncbi:MAG: hypothetical protein RIS75_611 [Actinomycetota bacterium]
MLTCILLLDHVSVNIDPVSAGLIAQGSNSTLNSVSVGVWGLIPSNTVTTPIAGTPLILSGLTKSPPTYFIVKNVGTEEVISFGLSVAFSAQLGSNSTQINSCSTSWNQSTHLCPGGIITTIVDTASAVSPVVVNGIVRSIPPANSVTYQVVTSKTGAQLTISVSVSNMGLRLPHSITN